MLPLVIIISGVTSFFTSNSEIDEGKTIFSFATPFIMLLERLVTREGIESYQKELSDCNEDFIKFYMTVKKAFKQVEKYYRVEIPIEEVEFINIYIQNMMVRSFDEYEGMEE